MAYAPNQFGYVSPNGQSMALFNPSRYSPYGGIWAGGADGPSRDAFQSSMGTMNGLSGLIGNSFGSAAAMSSQNMANRAPWEGRLALMREMKPLLSQALGSFSGGGGGGRYFDTQSRQAWG